MSQGKESITALEERLYSRSSGLKSIAKRSTFRLVIFLFRKLVTGKQVFPSKTIAGANDIPVEILRLNNISVPLRDLPLFFKVLTGRLALVAKAIKELSNSGATPEKGHLSMIKPGIVSLRDIRSSSKFDHQGQMTIAWESIFKKHLCYKFMLMLRALPAMLYKKMECVHSNVIAVKPHGS